jgi:hypothetical protein
MIIRPSTPQILRDLQVEVEREILPLMPDAVSKMRVQMLLAVLGNCAVRSAHEIAWMTQETAEIIDYARDVADLVSDDARRPVMFRLEEIAPDASRHLDDVAAAYSRAGFALSAALDAAMDAYLNDLVLRGEALLRARVTREQEIAGGSATTGR